MTSRKKSVESTFMELMALTIDIDWAPDFMIDFAAEALAARRVCATWFVTHSSPAVDRLRQHPKLFELGIHPNFQPGSTHGKEWAEVLDHCMGLVPDATSMRTHDLFQSTKLLDMIITQTPIITDLTLFLPYAASTSRRLKSGDVAYRSDVAFSRKQARISSLLSIFLFTAFSRMIL